MSKWSECAHTSGVWRVCARSGSRCIHTGRRHQRLTEGVSEAWCWRNFVVFSCWKTVHCHRSCRFWTVYSRIMMTSFKQTRLLSCIVFLYERSMYPFHSSWMKRTWLCTRGKKRYKYCSFSHTNRFVSCLRPSMFSYDGKFLIWISLCMFFFPLIETVTYTCHYMTDRLERFDLKTSKLDLLKKKRHPWGKLIDTKF